MRDIQWFFVTVYTILIAGGLVLAFFTYTLVTLDPGEPERIAVECAAQPGHEPFRLSPYRVICLDKTSQPTPPAR